MRTRSALSAIVAAVLVVAACGGDDEPESDADEPVATEPSAAAPQARCGDVTGGPVDAVITDVDCSTPHDAEFAGSVPTPDGESPTDSVAFDIALSSACLDVAVALAGGPLTDFGPDIVPVSSVTPGQDWSGDVDCWLRSPAIGSLTGSIAEVGLDEALGDFVTLGSMEPGECYLAAPENSGSISVGTAVGCDTPLADQILGTITFDDGPFPGDTDLFARGDEQCPTVAADAGIEPVGDVVAAIIPFETEWEAYGIRSIVCASYRSSDLADPEPFCVLDDPEGDDVLFDEQVSCDEPHDAEFAGAVDLDVDVLPSDPDEARTVLRRACRSIVEELTGRDASRPGIGVGFSSSSAPGEAVTEPIDCFAQADGADLLLAPMGDIGAEAALGDVKILADLEPGTCFTFATNSNNLGLLAECSPDVFVAVGTFEAEDGEYPGVDEFRLIRDERCAQVLADSGVAADPDTISGTFPGLGSWNGLDRRTVTCDATPL